VTRVNIRLVADGAMPERPISPAWFDDITFRPVPV
jgi:hypothetical protein